MAIDFAFRKAAVKTLTTVKGVYVLCDLDGVPIYVGKTKDGIRARVNRHLTSARSDIIANRQVDVWEIAYVYAYEASNKAQRDRLEAQLIWICHPVSALMNGTLPPRTKWRNPYPPMQEVQVMSDSEINDKLDEAQRLPRQAAHYAQIVGHFLAVKNSDQIALAMSAHFKRLSKYHARLLTKSSSLPEDNEADAE